MIHKGEYFMFKELNISLPEDVFEMLCKASILRSKGNLSEAIMCLVLDDNERANGYNDFYITTPEGTRVQYFDAFDYDVYDDRGILKKRNGGT